MNAKKKNKKANKPPNPTAPHSAESMPKKEEKIEELAPKCEAKENVVAPQVRSEVTETLVSDIKDMESETPKKPKRNKGKNKKQDKEENTEVQELPNEQQFEVVEEPLQKNDANCSKYEENIKNILDDADIVPSARKKKNKKKAQEKPLEEQEQSKTSADDNITTSLKKETVGSIEKIDTEIQELFSPISKTSKQEGKNKKNKKKNRTDSEKSDKSDVLLCTSAFQKILADDVSKPEQTAKSKEFLSDTKLESDTLKTENIEVIAVETEKMEDIQETNLHFEDTKEISKSENKGKKKNKKDKNRQKEEAAVAPKHQFLEETPMALGDILIKTIESHESIQIPFGMQKELSPKPTAKIVKPVEKKRKNKIELERTENMLNIESSEIVTDNIRKEGLPSENENKLDQSYTKDQTTQKLVEISSPIENISIPSDHAMGKKRKKSPKPHKNDKKDQSNETLEQAISKTDFISEANKKTQILLDLQSDSIVTDEPGKSSYKLDEVVSDKILKASNDALIDLTQKISIERPLTPEVEKDNEGFEVKTSKKKKKSPKIPQIEPTSEMIEPVVEATKVENTPKETIVDRSSVSVVQSLTADIKSQNPAAVPESAGCILIPEVHFMRSSSQQQLDINNNNNTVIQEIINVEDIKISDPQQIPLVEGSGATPARTPEPVLSSISDVGVKTSTEEKTDIKSKMIEVNQDMEDLRLSIERSLAEFTALEKCEKEKGMVKKSPLEKEKSPAKDNKKEAKQIQEIISNVNEDVCEVAKTNESEKSSPISIDRTCKPVETPPICPARKDNKSKVKDKSKKKLKQETSTVASTTAINESSSSETKDTTKKGEKDQSDKNAEQKSESSQEKSKQQSTTDSNTDDASLLKDTNSEKLPINLEVIPDSKNEADFEPIENFEDALTSSNDDVNKTFEMIAKEADDDNIEYQKMLAANKPEINITTAEETDKKKNEKVNPVSQPKNLLGHTDIPVQSNRIDYKKEKNKTPNARQAKVKIKDSMDIDTKKQSKESQTDSKRSCKISDKSVKESFSRVSNDNEEYVYKYSFRKVFLQSACHVCNRDLSQFRVPCGYCNLIFYCCAKHKDDDWPQHQALCFAVSTLAHMKDQKHIYADAANTTGQNYRLLRMQMIVSCEKVLKRRLVPWEQELMLYPRICADVSCREWRQGKLKDCDGCGQISFCAAQPEHLPKAHSRWCKSYSLYQKLVTYQQTKGRLEPRLPTRLLEGTMSGKMNEVLAAMYEEKIDMNDIQYASLTQLATAPLTTAYCLQLYRSVAGVTNGVHKKHPFTIHVVGAELQFEADALNKWETFFLHIRPDVEELRVVLISPQLNPGNLPLDLLGRIKLCEYCQQNKRRVIFKFEDNKNYFEYRNSEDFMNPDIICAFNPSIERSSIYNGKDPWPASINSILKLKVPFIITSYTLNELRKDIARIKQVSELDFKLVSEPGFNSFASVRPDRNFISDDEMPLLFKNYCVAVVLGC